MDLEVWAMGCIFVEAQDYCITDCCCCNGERAQAVLGVVIAVADAVAVVLWEWLGQPNESPLSGKRK